MAPDLALAPGKDMLQKLLSLNNLQKQLDTHKHFGGGGNGRPAIVWIMPYVLEHVMNV